MSQGNCAFVTLATNDTYSKGALVLAHSLKLAKTSHKLVILITNEVSDVVRVQLSKAFDVVENVQMLDSKDEARLLVLKRPELGVTFTKIHCWKLTQFSKCVFLDADTLVVKNCDELFERDEISAVPDAGWPDCFNSGVFVFKPSDDTHGKLMEMASEQGSFDGGDQGLLNSYFNDWATKDISRHLSFIYNMNTGASYFYLPAYRKFGHNVKIVHFLGAHKPWSYRYDKETGSIDANVESQHLKNYMNLWWKIYCENVEDQDSAASGIIKSMSDISLSPQKGESSKPHLERSQTDDSTRYSDWEQGKVDYMGKDSFENIMKKLDNTINSGKMGKN